MGEVDAECRGIYWTPGPMSERWIWETLALWLLVLRGPAFIDNLRAKSPRGTDSGFLPGVCLGEELV